MKTQKSIRPDKYHILIAEDSRAQAAVLKAILTGNGYEVTAVENGLDGLRKLAEIRPHLIISDIWMPKMNGLEFCRAIKADKDLFSIPVILLTSFTEINYIIKGLEAGADYYMTKPFSEDVLIMKVASILSNSNIAGNSHQKTSIEIRLNGKNEKLNLDPQKILNFLISTYENLISHNTKLTQTRQELKKLSDNLEVRVREKTFYLEEAEASLKDSLQSLKRTLGGTVKALAGTIEMRDPYTAGHQKRVTKLACAIGKEMDFPEAKLEGLQVISLLHDIGKIIVPAEILSRPGELNEIEFNLIKFHPQVGSNILKEIEFPWPVADAVAQHHERIDGSGYPNKLKGGDILIEAKIVAVAEVVEAMASHRPYRSALGIDAALSEITKNRGILYDEEVVDGCVRVFKEKNFSFDTVD